MGRAALGCACAHKDAHPRAAPLGLGVGARGQGGVRAWGWGSGGAVEWTPPAQERVPGPSEVQSEDEPSKSGCVPCRVYLLSRACWELAHLAGRLPRGGGRARPPPELRCPEAARGLCQVLPHCLGFDVLVSKPETRGPAAGGRED